MQHTETRTIDGPFFTPPLPRLFHTAPSPLLCPAAKHVANPRTYPPTPTSATPPPSPYTPRSSANEAYIRMFYAYSTLIYPEDLKQAAKEGEEQAVKVTNGLFTFAECGCCC